MDFERISNLERIIIIGIGGIGIRAIENMRSEFSAVQFLAIDTDEHLLNKVTCSKIKISDGLVFQEKLNKALEHCYLAVIVSCLGGETSTVVPLVAFTTRTLGILSIGLIIMPFAFENPIRKIKASQSFEELKLQLDTIVTISNKQLININKKNKIDALFKESCESLKWGVLSIISSIKIPGYLNYNVTDVRRAFLRRSSLARTGNLFVCYIKHEEAEKLSESDIIKSMISSIEFSKFDSYIFNIIIPDYDIDKFTENAYDLYKSIDEKIPEETFGVLSLIPDRSLFETLRIIVILINKN